MLTREEITPEFDQLPKEAIPNFTPYAFMVVGHVFYIVGAQDIGFGSEYAAVNELEQAVDVWNYHPIVGVNEKLHVQTVDLSGLESAQ